MGRAVWGVALAMLAGVGPAHAQQLDEDNPARAQRLRQEIEDRFAARVKQELGLSNDQLARLRATSATYGSQRRGLEARERLLRSALAEQMRPGVAANQDSVSKLTDGLVNLRSAYAQTLRDENRELSTYLTPVQRSQLLAMRERFQRRIREIREERRARQGLREDVRERRQERQGLRPQAPPRR
jgi:hypothetical protein